MILSTSSGMEGMLISDPDMLTPSFRGLVMSWVYRSMVVGNGENNLLTNERHAVVYLARKVDSGRWMPRFLASLQAYSSGQSYDLIVILKGYREGEVPDYLRNFVAPGLKRVITMSFDDSRFSTEAFFSVAERFDHDFFLFFVSSARVLGPSWLKHMFAPLLDKNTQLVGASSGFESLDLDTPYPNPSIRTNGFVMRRADWLSLERGDLSVRYGGNLFEAGPNSMTKQVLRRGGKILLVDRDGKTYPPQAWRDSATFRLSRQEKLLIADKRTDEFELALPRKRRRLVALNWGADVPVSTAPAPVVLVRRVLALVQMLYWSAFGRWLIRR